MKTMKEKSEEEHESSDEPAKHADYESYSSVEFTEPTMNDFDAELLQRFLKLLHDPSGSDDVVYDDLLPQPDHSAHSQNYSSGIHV